MGPVGKTPVVQGYPVSPRRSWALATEAWSSSVWEAGLANGGYLVPAGYSLRRPLIYLDSVDP